MRMRPPDEQCPPLLATTVTHITLSKKTTAKPCLEFYSDGGGEARRVTIENYPFRIGRAESADLRVESVEVSREHAEITERNGMWLVRDLGSTNGTQVNGKPIQEMLLADGDILKVAETEMTFIASAASQFQRMVTQPIQSRKVTPAPYALPPEVAAMRMMTEATLRQVIPTQLLAATSLRRGVTEAYFSPATTNAKQQPILDQPHIVGERYRELERMRALELAIKRTDAQALVPGGRFRRYRSAASIVFEPQAIAGPVAEQAGNWASRFRCRPTSTSCGLPKSTTTHGNTSCAWRSTSSRATARRSCTSNRCCPTTWCWQRT